MTPYIFTVDIQLHACNTCFALLLQHTIARLHRWLLLL